MWSPPSTPTGPPTAPSTRSPRCRWRRPTGPPTGRAATRRWRSAAAGSHRRSRPSERRAAGAADLHGQPDRQVLRRPAGRSGRRDRRPPEELLGPADARRDRRLEGRRRRGPRSRHGRGRGPARVPASRPYLRTRWTVAGPQDGQRELPEETAVALVHDATTTAVMMATPADLEDFGIGFSLTEGLVAAADEITGLEIAPATEGIEV